MLGWARLKFRKTSSFEVQPYPGMARNMEVVMGNFTLRLPESLHQRAKALAKKEGVSVNQFVTTALTEKLSALMTQDYLEARAQRSSQAASEQVLAKVPDTEPEVRDRL